MPKFEVDLKEKELAGLLGITRNELVRLRKTRGFTGCFKNGIGADRTIWWTKEGCEKVAAALGAKDVEGLPETKADAVKETVCGMTEEVEVVRSYQGYGNWRMMRCKFTRTGEEVWVRLSVHFVEQVMNYRPSMKFKARWDGSVWCQDGSPPRFYGRW